MIKEKLNEITALERDIREMREREARLLTPAITDYALLRQLLNVFVLSVGITGAMTKWQLRQFFFVVLWFCSPESFVCETTRKGVRKAVSQLLECSPSQLSKFIPTLTFFYQNYPDFRNSVDMVVGMTEKIITKGK